MRKMLLLPELVETIAESLRAAPPAALRPGAGDSLPRLLREVPRAAARDTSTPLPEGAEDVDPDRARARLRLVAAAKVVLARRSRSWA